MKSHEDYLLVLSSSAFSSWEYATQASKVSRPFPDRCTSIASWTLSSTVSPKPAAFNATPALSASASATAPGVPDSVSRNIAAFTNRSPPFKSATSQRLMPTSSGSNSYCTILPSFTSATVAGPMGVSSSMPRECTTSARFVPRSLNALAMSGMMSGEYTPTNAKSAAAGLSMGPRMLKAVRTPRDLRTGTTARITGWYRGAYMNPTLVLATHLAMDSGPSSTATPSASSTSALPHMLDTERLPCLATFAPAAAARMAEPVEMLTEPIPSPPVPAMSSTPAPQSTRTALARMAEASPAISSGVSPLARSSTRKAAVCAGSSRVKSVFNAAALSSNERFSRSMRRSITCFRSPAGAAPTAAPCTRKLLERSPAVALSRAQVDFVRTTRAKRHALGARREAIAGAMEC
mmetsp:Transcript_13263/g.25422  ORF Transcript_13263/g.25422 Transcript_13263/m.25422 type:complete len:406 (-) Transcript_13263:86-1303(-)